MTDTPKKRGRPTIYKDTYPDELIDLMSKGQLNCQIVSKWDINEDTFYTWLKTKPDLKEAYEIGLPKCQSWWLAWGQQGMMGQIKGFNFNAWIAFMNNKFGWTQGSKQGSEGSATTINIKSINVVQGKSNAQLLDYIKGMATKHSDIIDVQLIECTPTNDEENSDKSRD